MIKKDICKIVLVPCPVDGEGRYGTENFRAPYGYHHILRIYKDGSCWLMATVEGIMTDEEAKQVADLLASFAGVEVEIQPLFYKEQTDRYV